MRSMNTYIRPAHVTLSNGHTYTKPMLDLIRKAISGDMDATSLEQLEDELDQAQRAFEARESDRRREYEERSARAEARQARIDEMLGHFDPVSTIERCGQRAGGRTRSDFLGHNCNKDAKWILSRGPVFEREIAPMEDAAKQRRRSLYCGTHRNEYAGTRRSW